MEVTRGILWYMTANSCNFEEFFFLCGVSLTCRHFLGQVRISVGMTDSGFKNNNGTASKVDLVYVSALLRSITLNMLSGFIYIAAKANTKYLVPAERCSCLPGNARVDSGILQLRSLGVLHPVTKNRFLGFV